MDTWGPYPTNLTDAEWEFIRPEILWPNFRSRAKHFNYRKLVDTLFYLTKTGCQYRMLPADLCKRGVTNKYLRRWQQDGTWQRILDALRRRIREQEGRLPQPSLVVLDSQSAATTAIGGEQRGFDGGKLVDGRKRHIGVDTLGLLLAVVVTAANVADGVAAPRVMERITARSGARVRLVYADSRYNDRVFGWWLKRHEEIHLVIVSRPKGTGFVVLKRRWVVERTFAWLLTNRRLSKDYERTVASSEAVVKVAAIRQMLKRIKHNPKEKSGIGIIDIRRPQAA
jgi:putative transposase